MIDFSTHARHFRLSAIKGSFTTRAHDWHHRVPVADSMAAVWRARSALDLSTAPHRVSAVGALGLNPPILAVDHKLGANAGVAVDVIAFP